VRLKEVGGGGSEVCVIQRGHILLAFKFQQREFALSTQFGSDSISGNVKSRNFLG